MDRPIGRTAHKAVHGAYSCHDPFKDAIKIGQGAAADNRHASSCRGDQAAEDGAPRGIRSDIPRTRHDRGQDAVKIQKYGRPSQIHHGRRRQVMMTRGWRAALGHRPL
jgi:hypothetical protein